MISDSLARDASSNSPALVVNRGSQQPDRARPQMVAGIALLLVGLSSLAWQLSDLVGGSVIGQAIPGMKNVFYRLYGLHERPLFTVLGVFMGCAAVYLTMRQNETEKDNCRGMPSQLFLLGLACVVMGTAWLGHRAVMHSFPLSMDEYNADFQSRLFAGGHLSAPVPSQWQAMVPAITPTFITYKPSGHSWLSSYLPVYSGLRALALKLSLAPLLNPILAGLSLLSVAAIAKRLWPGYSSAPVLAALLLASSSQFLATSMTTYSMPAHLCFNLLWLMLYLKSEGKGVDWAVLLLPWVGILALGLHNPFPHALFAAPFLLRIVRSRGVGVSAYVGAVYVVGCALWLAWLGYSVSPSEQAVASSMFGFPDSFHLLTEAMSLSLILSWQTPVMVLGLALAVASARRLSSFERDLLAGVALTCCCYFLFVTSQGHGWGYRYTYNVLGNLVLLGVAGLFVASEHCGIARTRRLVGASLVASVIIQLPVRARQVERFVRPFATASRAISESGDAAVVIPTSEIWYGSDLIRNGPYVKAPVIIAESRSHPSAQGRWLELHVVGRIRYLRLSDLAATGLVGLRQRP